MKILLYGLNFTPELTGVGKYTGEMAAWLAAQGHEVRVVTAPPYYPAWKVGEGFRNWWGAEVMDCHGADAPRNDGDLVSSLRAQRGNPPPVSSLRAQRGNPPPDSSLRAKRGNPVESGGHGLPRRYAPRNDGSGSLLVYRCPLWVPAAPGGAKRLLHLASFALSSLPVLLRQVLWRADVVWVVEPALFCAPAACLVARLGGSKAWLHVQDFEVDAAFSLNLLKGQRVKNAVLAAERWLMRRFDVVSTISGKMISLLQQKGVSPSRTVLAPNWVDISAITPRPAQAGPSPFKAELGLPPHAVVALYSGNMGGKQGLEVMAEAAKLCLIYEQNRAVDPADKALAAIIFVFCGNGAGRADLQARCAHLPNVRFLDLQPMARLNDLLALADLHLLPQRADAADLVMPSKLTGMLASGRAVVATAHPGTELANVVQGLTQAAGSETQAACGVVVPPEAPALLAQALIDLAQNPTERARMGAVGRRYAEQHLHTDAVLGQFVARVGELVG